MGFTEIFQKILRFLDDRLWAPDDNAIVNSCHVVGLGCRYRLFER